MRYYAEVNKNKAGTLQVMVQRRGAFCDVVDEKGRWYFNDSYQKFKNGTLLFSDEAKTIDSSEEMKGPIKTYGADIGIKDPKELITYHRNQTLEEARKLVSYYGKCAIIRPCGFGKTWLFFQIAQSYKRCLFVYPGSEPSHMDEINKKVNKRKKLRFTTIHYKTYNWLANLSADEILDLDYDLIFFDEMHYLGGDERSKAAQKVMMAHEDHTHFIGATATENRLDGRDVLGCLFDGIHTYDYDLTRALNDGVIKEPKYYVATYTLLEYIQNISRTKFHQDISRDEAEKMLGTIDLEKFDAHKLDVPIKEACKEFPEDSYMKFVVFCKTIDSKNDETNIEKTASIIGSFMEKAFPQKKINVIKFSSRHYADHDEDFTKAQEKQLLKDIKQIKEMPAEKNKVDVIVSCEKLAYGYHDENLTGIIMYRLTYSQLKYIQMIGRSFSCESENPPIVFDIVDNYSRQWENNRLEKVSVEIDKVKKELPTFEEVLEDVKHHKNVKYWYKPVRKHHKKDNSTKEQEEQEEQIVPEEQKEEEKPEYTNEDVILAYQNAASSSTDTKTNEEVEPQDASQDVDNLENETQTNDVSSDSSEPDDMPDDIKELSQAKALEGEDLFRFLRWHQEKARKRYNERMAKEANRATMKEAFGKVGTLPKHTTSITTSPKPKFKTETKSSYKDPLENENAITCRAFGYEHSIVDLTGSAIKNQKIAIEELIATQITEPIFKNAYNAYLEVKNVNPITTIADITGDSERSKFQAALIKHFAKDYNVKEDDLIAYILKKAS